MEIDKDGLFVHLLFKLSNNQSSEDLVYEDLADFEDLTSQKESTIPTAQTVRYLEFIEALPHFTWMIKNH